MKTDWEESNITCAIERERGGDNKQKPLGEDRVWPEIWTRGKPPPTAPEPQHVRKLETGRRRF